eukprot:364647-Chlamydomonas_euryale.AAC.5
MSPPRAFFRSTQLRPGDQQQDGNSTVTALRCAAQNATHARPDGCCPTHQQAGGQAGIRGIPDSGRAFVGSPTCLNHFR